MSSQNLNTSKHLGIPNPNGAIFATAGVAPTIGMNGHRPQSLAMSCQPLETMTVARPPHPQQSTHSRTDDSLSIGANCYRLNLITMSI
jgi:hypothetical protein